MFHLISNLAGGIGLFLLGMGMLTDGLRTLAGDSLRKALIFFTKRPGTAFISGAIATAIVQSSSATTLMTIGFVSAGLLAFSQSIGLMIGASLGTTSTGWLVALIGLKFSISKIALVLVFIGAFAHLLGSNKIRHGGLAVAGFGLIFVGLDLLQSGMAELALRIDLASLPTQGFTAHALLLGIGLIMTIIMQSSSAAVATTLTALQAGAINFEQATAIVIGSAIGTTATAALAVIGASVAAKRTALAHIAFNTLNGLLALMILPLLLSVIYWMQDHWSLEPGAISLAAFHTLFIALGVVLALPFCRQFGLLIEKILPDANPTLTRYLDESVLQIPAVALEAVHRCLWECLDTLKTRCQLRITDQEKATETQEATREVLHALNLTQQYLTQIVGHGADDPLAKRKVNAIHAIDHLTSLCGVIEQQTFSAIAAPAEEKAVVLAFLQALQSPHQLTAVEAEATSKQLAEARRKKRAALLEEAAAGEEAPEKLLATLDAIRWMDQVVYHIWRIRHHLGEREAIAQDLKA